MGEAVSILLRDSEKAGGAGWSSSPGRMPVATRPVSPATAAVAASLLSSRARFRFADRVQYTKLCFVCQHVFFASLLAPERASLAGSQDRFGAAFELAADSRPSGKETELGMTPAFGVLA